MRLIDADKLYDDVEGKYKLSCGDRRLAYRMVLDDICSAPDVDNVKHGKWVGVAGGLRVKCSVCESGGESQPIVLSFYAYCPHCGAKMDSEDNNAKT